MVSLDAMTAKYDNMPDQCQECVKKKHYATSYPREVKRRKRPRRGYWELEAYYTCSEGHTWTCWWSIEHWRD